MNSRWSRRVSAVVTSPPWIALGAYVALALALGGRSSVPRVCPFYRVFGRDCPLCGLTRALGLIGRGRIGEAVRAYPRPLVSGAALTAFAFLKTMDRRPE